jgi:F5/8 type C domain-containing protein
MPIKVLCACGKSLHANESLAGRRVKCPSCGAALAIPAPARVDDFASFTAVAAEGPIRRPPTAGMSSGPWIAAGVVGLAVLVGILVACLRSGSPAKAEDKPKEPPKVAVVPDHTSRDDKLVPFKPAEKPPETVKEDTQPALPLTEQEVKDLYVAPPKLSKETQLRAPDISRVQPEHPKAGDALVVELKGGGTEGETVDYQYRTDARSDWQPAPNGRVTLVNLKQGELMLEVRAQGTKGKVSPVATRSWMVRAIDKPPPTREDSGSQATWEGGVLKLKRVPPVVTDNKNTLVKRYRTRMRLFASSVWGGWPVENALDGNIESSWFSEHGDAAAMGRSPWLQAVFPENVAVTRVTILGNRDPAWLIGYTILEGRLTVYNARGKVIRTITNKGIGNFRDFDYKFNPPLRGVRAIRFTSLRDQGNQTVHKDIGLAEFQVEGFKD